MINSFLIIKGLPGTSTIDPKGATIAGTKAIEIHSFSWGVHNGAASAKASGESRAGRPDFAELSIMKNVDPTSSKLMEKCLTCVPFTEAELGFMKQINDTNECYFHIHLKQVYITSMQVSGGSENPQESVSIAYEEIEFAYKPEKPDKKGLDGWVGTKWNVKSNK